MVGWQQHRIRVYRICVAWDGKYFQFAQRSEKREIAAGCAPLHADFSLPPSPTAAPNIGTSTLRHNFHDVYVIVSITSCHSSKRTLNSLELCIMTMVANWKGGSFFKGAQS